MKPFAHTSRRPLAALSVVAAAVLTVAACSSANPTATPSTSPAVEPVGIIAMGHSGLTGENSDPANPHMPAPQNSWATGDNPAVNSIYSRMVALWPETKKHALNAATGGATVDALMSQTQLALAYVPTPRLAIIQTIDGDINCPNPDPGMVKFGKKLDAVLAEIHNHSPKTQMFVLLYSGHPALQVASDAIAAKGDPEMRRQMTGPAPCGLLDEKGKVRTESVQFLTHMVNDANSQVGRVCAKYPTCRTDKGYEYGFVPPKNGFNKFNDHFSVVGLRAWADYFWPHIYEQLKN